MAVIDDIIGRLRYGGPPESEEEPQDNPEDTPSSDPSSESTAEGQVDADPADEPEDPPVGEEQDADTPEDDDAHQASEGEGAESDEDTEDSSESEEQPLFEIDGESYTLEQMREFRDNGMMRQAFSRKTQEVAAARKRLEDRDELLEAILGDSSLSPFVKAHPTALTTLVKQPEATRALLGDAAAVRQLWDDWELALERPHLREKLLAAPEEATDTLEDERYIANLQGVAKVVDEKIQALSQEYEGVSKEEVEEFVFSLGGFEKESEAEEVAAGLERLFGLMFDQGPEGDWDLNDKLIRDRFELLSRVGAAPNVDDDAEDHNRAVDEQLQDNPVSASAGGDAPAPEPEPLDDGLTFEERVAKLRGTD